MDEDCENHNSGQFLKVEWSTGHFPRWRRGRGGHGLQAVPGWYVIRICPCHYGHPVTRSYPTEERAERVRRAMIAASMALGT